MFVKDVSGCPIYSVEGILQGVGIEVWVRVPPSAPSFHSPREYRIMPLSAAAVDPSSVRFKTLSGIDISSESNRFVS